VLGGARRFSPDPADFHQLDLSQELRIDLYLRKPLRRENVFRKIDEVHGFFFRVWRAERGGERGQLKTEHYCFGADGKTYVPPAAVARRGESGRAADSEPIRALPAPASRVVPQLGAVHYLSPNMYRAFETSGYGVLAQLLDLYRDDFRSAENTYKLPGPGGEVVTRADAYDRFAVRLSEILRTEKLTEIETSLSQNLQAVLGPTAAGAEVTIALPTAEELLAEILSLRIRDDAASPVLSVDRLGGGYRSLLRLAILRTYAELAQDVRPAVFLIEEPEAYLNPHLRRFFGTTIRLLAEVGNDVVLTTHDAAFVSLPEYRTVLRVAKARGRSVVYRCTEPLDFSSERLAQKLRRGGNSEVLFAARAILCEGSDDVAAVRALLDRLGIEPDNLNISVVDCGGRDALPDYIRLLDALSIDLLVITDGDAAQAEKDDSTRKKVAAVEAAAGDRMFRFSEDIEDALGCEKQRDNAAQLVAIIDALDLAALADESEMSRLAGTLRAFCNPPPPAPSTEPDRPDS
jgi:Overcoming lysogenization defect protein-like, TOPRIM domain/AAA ATPase domain